MNDSYVKLNRNIAYWEWYKNNNTKALFLHCLIKANWIDGKFEGKEIKRGSFVSSIKNLSSELNMSADEIRTALKHLEQTGEITKQSTNKFTVITVNNYCIYQDVPKQLPNNYQTITEQTPNEAQADTKQFPTIEEYKNIRNKEDNNIYNTAKEHEREAEELFNRLWKLYPRKLGKGQVKMRQKLRLRKIGYDDLALAIEKYKQHIEDKNTSEDYIMYGSTFFNSGYVDFLPDSNEQPTQNQTQELYSAEDIERLKRLGIDIDD